MMKKPAKSTPSTDSERETRVLLEQVNHNVKTIAEQHGSILKKLEEHDKQFSKIGSELNFVKVAVIENNKEIKGLRTEIEKVKTGQEVIEQKIDTVTSDHEQRLHKLEAV